MTAVKLHRQYSLVITRHQPSAALCMMYASYLGQFTSLLCVSVSVIIYSSSSVVCNHVVPGDAVLSTLPGHVEDQNTELSFNNVLTSVKQTDPDSWRTSCDGRCRLTTKEYCL